MKKKTTCLVTLANIVLTSCVSQPTTDLTCEEVIRLTWGTQENEVGFDSDDSFDTAHKVLVDEVGNILILDSYNDRVTKFSSSGDFQNTIEIPDLPEFANEHIEDIALGVENQINAAISAPVTFDGKTAEAYSAIYVFDSDGGFLYPVSDWRDSAGFAQRIEHGLQYQVPFHYLAGSLSGEAYSIWATGSITQYNPQGISTQIYNRRWLDVISGWDNFLYVVGGEPGGNTFLLQYEHLDARLVERIDLDSWTSVRTQPPRDILVGVDYKGNLYFERYDEESKEMSMIILDQDGDLVAEVTLPNRLAFVGQHGGFYLFAYDANDIPSQPFSITRCNSPLH